MLRESDVLEEQGDILQYLVDSKGLDFHTGMLEKGRVVTVRDLLKGLYEKACQQKLWGLVRHTAGMLGKRVEDLAKAVTDLLVRQKQITVGMPPNNEHTITAPLPESDLRLLIHEAYGKYQDNNFLIFGPNLINRYMPQKHVSRQISNKFQEGVLIFEVFKGRCEFHLLLGFLSLLSLCHC